MGKEFEDEADGGGLPGFSGAIFGIEMDKIDVLGLELHCLPRNVVVVGACAAPSPRTRRKTSLGPNLLNDPI